MKTNFATEITGTTRVFTRVSPWVSVGETFFSKLVSQLTSPALPVFSRVVTLGLARGNFFLKIGLSTEITGTTRVFTGGHLESR